MTTDPAPLEVMTIREAARRLDMSRTTLYAAIRDDITSVPGAARIGGRVFIRRAPFERWMAGGDAPQLKLIHRKAS